MLEDLETRFIELKKILNSLAPKTASQSCTIDYLQMQTYVLGFQDAIQIITKSWKTNGVDIKTS